MPSVNVMMLGKEPAMPSALTFALGITGKMIFFHFFLLYFVHTSSYIT